MKKIKEFIRNFVNRYYVTKGMVLVSSDSAERLKIFALIDKVKIPQSYDIEQIKEKNEMFMSDLDAYLICTIVEKTKKIEGDIAEVGVYKGGSAKLICQTTNKLIHLFDTFEGLPDVGEYDSPILFHKGDYCCSLEIIKEYLKDYSNVSFYKGIFPYTAGPIKDKKFSFVHLDVDLYKSTIDSLEFFYPRMSRGGVILSHDYPTTKGVQKAFDEFFKDKTEIVISSFGTKQALVIKV